MVIVAQLVRALVCGAGGRGFESHQSPIFPKVEEQHSSSFFIWYSFLAFSTGALSDDFQAC